MRAPALSNATGKGLVEQSRMQPATPILFANLPLFKIQTDQSVKAVEDATAYVIEKA